MKLTKNITLLQNFKTFFYSKTKFQKKIKLTKNVTYKERYVHIKERIWIYAREIQNINNLSYKTNDGVLQVRKRDLHMVFIDYKKVYKVPREVMWCTMTKNIPKKYINILPDMY